jgi:hypothetical protein
MQVKDKARFFTTAEVCDLFGISRSTLFRWEKDPDFPSVGRDRGKANMRLYGKSEMRAVRTKSMSGLFRAASRDNDIEALRGAHELLYLRKLQSGDFVGIDELRSFAEDNRLSPGTLQQLVRLAGERVDPEDENFRNLIEIVWKSCRSEPKQQHARSSDHASTRP